MMKCLPDPYTTSRCPIGQDLPGEGLLRRTMPEVPWLSAVTASPFANLPHVPEAQELLDRAFGRASKLSKEDPNAVWKARRLTAAKLQSAAENMNQPLAKVVQGFPSFDQLHPFYIELVELAVGLDGVRKALGSLDWARKEVLQIGQQTSNKALKLRFPQQAEGLLSHAYGRLSSVIKQVSPGLVLLKEARKKMRALPGVDTDLPMAVVCGAPNVGKSSIVRALSTGKPEVAAYPFTTKEVSLGHIPHRYVKLQVMDTPGLLDRSVEERNEVEQQAAAALFHLDPLIIFVLDPSLHCGYPLKMQMKLRADMREELPGQPWIEAWAKADLTGESDLEDLGPVEPELEVFKVSAESGEGMGELKAKVIELMDRKLREMADKQLMESVE